MHLISAPGVRPKDLVLALILALVAASCGTSETASRGPGEPDLGTASRVETTLDDASNRVSYSILLPEPDPWGDVDRVFIGEGHPQGAQVLIEFSSGLEILFRPDDAHAYDPAVEAVDGTDWSITSIRGREAFALEPGDRTIDGLHLRHEGLLKWYETPTLEIGLQGSFSVSELKSAARSLQPR